MTEQQLLILLFSSSTSSDISMIMDYKRSISKAVGQEGALNRTAEFILQQS